MWHAIRALAIEYVGLPKTQRVTQSVWCVNA